MEREEGSDLAALGERSATLAHDFNNVASVIGVYVDALLGDPSLSDRARSSVEAIRDQVERGAALAWSVLDLVHHRPPERRPVDVVALVRDLALSLRGSPSVTVTVSPDVDSVVVDADDEQLRQLLLALVDNARDAGADDVAISITLAPGGCVTVDVADTGGGIEADVLSRVCDPFVTTKGPLGLGLGLAHASRIARDHGGALDVASTVGVGTTVSLTVPARSSGTVLVVDDDPDVRTALVELLESMGHAVVAATDATSALEFHARLGAAIELVVSDVTMRGGGGVELHRVLRERDPRLPVVLISGRPRPDDAPAGVRWLRKPFSRDQLAAVIAPAPVP